MKHIKTKQFIINYSESLIQLVEATQEILTVKLKEFQKIFNININERIQINYFDDINEFRAFIYKIRGESNSLPDYATGTYDNGSINAYVKKENQMSRLYTSSHELFHILYMKEILKNDYSNRVVWYDEGMAQFLSGEKRNLEDEELFKKFYIKVKNQTKTFPKINLIRHGSSFVNDMYNGYDLSFLAISFLNETLTKQDFINLMSDFSKIKQIGESIIDEMFLYYDNKYLIKQKNKKEGIK